MENIMFNFKQLTRNKLLLISLSFLLTIATGSRVQSITPDTVNSSPVPTQATNVIAQSFSEIDFNNIYYATLSEADRYYQQGDLQKVKQIQQQVKPEFAPAAQSPAPQDEIAQLPAIAQQYWTTANQALKEDPEDDDEIDTRIFEPLESLVDDFPQFVPGHVLLADTYDLYGWEEDALDTIETASELYPNRTDVLDKKIELLAAYGKPLEASIAAREFVYSNPDSPKTQAYEQAADQYFQKYQSGLKSKITASGVIGGIGQAATGSRDEGISVGMMLLQGESSAGEAFAESIKSEAALVTNAEQLKYLNDIGQRLAKLMGRDEFTYEFNIVEDPTPNAFALPGGKIFFHTGMLQLMDSEAELAGVLAHEIAHSVLSHSYQQIGESALASTGTNLLSSFIGKEVGTVAQVGQLLLSKKFSRDKEKQSDVLGIRVLDAAGYSADGLYNVMAKLKQLSGKSNFAESLLSSHPASEERMRYLEELIQTKGYNRYGYEGVEKYRSVFPRQ